MTVDAINKALTHNVVGSRLCGESRPRTALTELVHRRVGDSRVITTTRYSVTRAGFALSVSPNSDGLHKINALKTII